MTLNTSSKHAMNQEHVARVMHSVNAKRLDRAMRDSKKEEKAIRRIAEEVRKEHMAKKANPKPGNHNTYLGR
jgi:hypothetical protein